MAKTIKGNRSEETDPLTEAAIGVYIHPGNAMHPQRGGLFWQTMILRRDSASDQIFTEYLRQIGNYET